MIETMHPVCVAGRWPLQPEAHCSLKRVDAESEALLPNGLYKKVKD